MTLSCYVFVGADSAEEARTRVEDWLIEYHGREFYDGYDVGEAVHLDTIPVEYFDKELCRVEDNLARFRENADSSRCDRLYEGQNLMSAASILLEHLCPEMPWFNTVCWDWTVPDAEEAWEAWAVMTTFHY